MQETAKKREKRLKKVGWVSVFSNLLLSVAKIAGGILVNSQALLADGVHSASDLSSDFVVLFALQISGKPADDNHPYGHGKFETLASVVVAVILIAIAVGIFWSGLQGIISAARGERLPSPGMAAFYVALLSILIKEWLFRYTYKAGVQENSRATIANAWHHRSDMFSSIATAAGIGGALLLGEAWNVLDPVAAILVSVVIIRAAVRIGRQDLDELLERSLNKEQQEEIFCIVKSTEGVMGAHKLRTRAIGQLAAISLHITVAPDLNICTAHDIATSVENALRERFGSETFLSVHVEPDRPCT